MISEQEHLRLAEAKMDASWARYHAGRIDLVDRYNVTAALVCGDSVLDVGCGECLLGHLLRRLGHTDMHITGVDISLGEMENARSLNMQYHAEIELYQMDAETMTFAPHKFDTVVLGQTLEHVRYPDRVADEAVRVLKPGGRLIVNVPSDDERPYGNHLHVFHKVGDMLDLFGDDIKWQGGGRMHNFWFAWGVKK